MEISTNTNGSIDIHPDGCVFVHVSDEEIEETIHIFLKSDYLKGEIKLSEKLLILVLSFLILSCLKIFEKNLNKNTEDKNE